MWPWWVWSCTLACKTVGLLDFSPQFLLLRMPRKRCPQFWNFINNDKVAKHVTISGKKIFPAHLSCQFFWRLICQGYWVKILFSGFPSKFRSARPKPCQSKDWSGDVGFQDLLPFFWTSVSMFVLDAQVQQEWVSVRRLCFGFDFSDASVAEAFINQIAFPFPIIFFLSDIEGAEPSEK